ncbi:restriction endonuclease subunit S [Candidatus Pelagibacter sp.]|nr:restriction endonuclease subunit S [Candidatus Pelagibacter sp.]
MMWSKVKLRDLLEVQNGYAFNSKEFNTLDGMPLIRIRDLKNGVSTKTYYTGKYEKKYIVHSGDFLIGMDGEFRCYQWKGKNALLNQRVCRLQNFSKKLNPKFLYYIINKELKLIEDKTGFITVKHLSSNTIKEIEVSLPSIKEQELIVAKLDAVFSEIDKVEKNYHKKKLEIDLIKNKFLFNKFSKVKNFKLTLLNEICNKITDGSHNPPKIIKGSSFMMLSSKNIFDDSINYEKPRLISEESFHSENKRTDIKKNDVLLTIVGTIGRCAVVKSDDIKFTVQRSVAVFKPKNNLVESRFLMYLLQSLILDFKKQAAGVAQQGIYLKQLKNTEVKIPPLDKQKKLVNEIDKFNNKLEELNKILIKQKINYDSLRLSILSQKIKKKAA